MCHAHVDGRNRTAAALRATVMADDGRLLLTAIASCSIFTLKPWNRGTTHGMSDDLLKIKEKERVTREEAAARLRAIADELASGNDVVFERDGMRIVAKVPAEVDLEVEFEVGEDETELEIELKWGGLSG